jgi:hypothetical protein
MTDKDDYRLYLEEKFEGIHKIMSARFENVEDKLDGIWAEARKTNSRVTHLEDDVVNVKLCIKDEFVRIENEVDNTIADVHSRITKAIEERDKDLEEYHIVKRYPKAALAVLFVFLAGFALSVLSVVQNAKSNTKSNKIIEQTEQVEGLVQEVIQ